MKRLLGSLVPLVALALLLPAFTRAQEQRHRAGLVVRHGDGRVATACVTFTEPSLSGIELLKRSGFRMITQGGGIGAAVCKLDNEGCDYPTEGCFCKRDGAQSIYWAYSQLRDGVWAFSPLGASSTTVQDGDVDGWAWGTGDSRAGAVPPVVPLDQICAVAPPVAPTARPARPTARPTRLPPTATSAPVSVTAAAAQAATAAAPTAGLPALPPPTLAAAPTARLPALPPPTLVASMAAATARPTEPLPTAEAAGGAAPAPAAPESGMANYLGFGLLALLLLGGIIVAARR